MREPLPKEEPRGQVSLQLSDKQASLSNAEADPVAAAAAGPTPPAVEGATLKLSRLCQWF